MLPTVARGLPDDMTAGTSNTAEPQPDWRESLGPLSPTRREVGQLPHARVARRLRMDGSAQPRPPGGCSLQPVHRPVQIHLHSPILRRQGRCHCTGPAGACWSSSVADRRCWTPQSVCRRSAGSRRDRASQPAEEGHHGGGPEGSRRARGPARGCAGFSA